MSAPRLVPGFVPQRVYRGVWVSVSVCKECSAVMAVRQDLADPPLGWHTRDGDDRGPCCACGFYRPPTTKEIAGQSRTVVHHIESTVARYHDPCVWWNPWTWGLVGQWELRDPETRESTPKPAPMPPPVAEA